MSRAPRKYADRERTQVTPEWRQWREGQARLLEESGPEILMVSGFDPDTYFPELVGKDLPDEGAWVIVVEEPFTQLRDQFRIPPLSMWRARPFQLSSGGVQVGSIKVYPYQAVIATPAGDLHLWPHEYIVAEQARELAACEGAELHQLGGEAALDEDQMFYLQSRGIQHHDAVLLLWDAIVNVDFIYVTFPTEVTDQLAGVGQPLRRYMALNPRVPA